MDLIRDTVEKKAALFEEFEAFKQRKTQAKLDEGKRQHDTHIRAQMVIAPHTNMPIHPQGQLPEFTRDGQTGEITNFPRIPRPIPNPHNIFSHEAYPLNFAGETTPGNYMRRMYHETQSRVPTRVPTHLTRTFTEQNIKLSHQIHGITKDGVHRVPVNHNRVLAHPLNKHFTQTEDPLNQERQTFLHSLSNGGGEEKAPAGVMSGHITGHQRHITQFGKNAAAHPGIGHGGTGRAVSAEGPRHISKQITGQTYYH